MFLTFITAVTSEDEHSVLTAVQLLWVNLIMDTLAALALATDPPTRSILDRKPEPKSAPLISLTMWKMIIGQSIFQLAVTFIVYYAGPQIMNLPPTTGERNGDRRMQALIFNVFVWMQIFNQYNCRRLDNKFNFFEGITKNYFFMIIQVIIIAGQVMIIFVGDIAFSVTRIDGVSWAVSIVLGLLSIPVGLVIRCIPDEWIRKCIPAYFKRKKTPALVVTDEEQQWQWNPGMEEIREELAFLKRLRGGRLNTLKHKLKNPREMLPRSRSGSRTSSMPQTPNNEPSDQSGNPGAPPTPDSRRSMQRRRARSHSNSAFGPAAAMAGIVAGSIGGWSPIERRDGDSFARFPLQDRSDLEGHPGVEIHPDTKPDDPVLSDPEDFKGRPPSQSPEMNPAFRGPPKSPKAGGSSKEKEN